MGSFTEYVKREKELCLAADIRRKHLPRIYLYESKEENEASIINIDLTHNDRIIAGDGFAYSTDENLVYTDMSRCCTRLTRRLLAMGETEYVLQVNRIPPGLSFKLTQTDHASKLEEMLQIFIRELITNRIARKYAQHK